MQLQWKLVEETGRSFADKDGTHLVVGCDEHSIPRRYWFAAFKGGVKISEGRDYGSRDEAQLAAETVVL